MTDVTTVTSTTTNDSISKIDAAIAAAKARKAKKESEAVDASGAIDDAKAAKAIAKAEREEKKAQIARDREARAAERAQKKANRTATQSTGTKPVHMSKVERAAQKLPAMTTFTEEVFRNVTVNCTAADISALALHLQHFNRQQATQRSIGAKVEVGSRVEVIGGDPKYIGKVGSAVTVQRIRCYVEIEGISKPVYLFISDVKVLEQQATSVDQQEELVSTGTEG